jgi:urease accessory protein
MNRVVHIERAGEWDSAKAVDRIVLDADDRRRRRIVLTAEKSTTFLLDLARPIILQDGDGLVLDDGGIVQVIGKPEPLLEIRASVLRELVRFAWHLGNRHTDIQIVGDAIRIRYDHVLEDMLHRLGAKVTPLEAPFDPEAGAHTHDHSHGHERDPGHAHDHHHQSHE